MITEYINIALHASDAGQDVGNDEGYDEAVEKFMRAVQLLVDYMPQGSVGQVAFGDQPVKVLTRRPAVHRVP